MSNAIAQSATQVTLSTNGEEAYDFFQAADRAATRSAKGLVRESRTLNRQKLISMVCADYRMHFAAIYGKTERLPSAVFEKVELAVDAEIAKSLKLVHAGNATTMRRAFAHKANDLKFVERVTVVGENEISLAEQHLAATIAITAAERRLRDLEAKKTPDLERETAVKKQIMQLTLTKNFIEGEQKHQKELAATEKK